MTEAPIAPRPAIFAFLLLIAFAVFPPFVPLAGPLSLDDVFPLLALFVVLMLLPLRRTDLPVDVTIIGFVLFAAFGLLSSAVNGESLGDFLRLAGRSTGRAMFYFGLTVGARMMLGGGRWPRRAMLVLAAAATLEAMFSIWSYQAQYTGPFGIGAVKFADWSVLAGQMRVQGTFSGAQNRFEANGVSANFLAAYLVMSVPLTVGIAATGRLLERGVAGLAAFVQIIALYLTYTRAALVALAVAALVFGFLLGKKKLAVGLVTIGLVAALAIPSIRGKILGEGHDRWALYWAAAAITLDHPIVGVGDGNYERVLHENQDYHDTPFGSATATSHNSVLLSAAILGIGGGAAHLLLYVLVLIVALRAVRDSTSREGQILAASLCAACVGFLSQDQLNNLAYVPKVATQFWFLVGLLPVVAKVEPRQSDHVSITELGSWPETEPARQRS